MQPTALPFEMAALVAFSSFVIVGLRRARRISKLPAHVLGPAAIAMVVAFSLVVLLDLSYPPTGDFTVDPEPLETGVLARFFETSR